MVRLFRPFDVATLAGRGKERYRRIGLAAAAALVQRVIAIIATLITVRITLDYLGAERYGVFVAMTAAVALLAFADLGIGNGLVNAISEAHARGDEQLARVYVSSAAAVLTGLAIVLGGTFALAYPRIPWADVFNVSSPEALADIGPAAAVFVGCFLAALPLSIVQRVQLGYQEGFAYSVWLALGNVLGLAGVVIAISLQASLPWLVFAAAGAPLLSAGLNGAVLFGVRRPWLRPGLGAIRSAATRKIVGLGSYFFILQLSIAVAFESDAIVIAQVLGPEQVPQYSIPFRLSMFVPLVLSFVLVPLWPAYAEAIERGDAHWVRTAFRRSLALGLGMNIPAAAVLVAFGDVLVRIWVGTAITPTNELLVGLALWMVLTGVGGPVATLLNGAGLIRFQAICAVVMVVANLPLSVLFAHLIGVSGVIYASVISLAVCVYAPAAIFIRLWFRHLESKEVDAC